MAEETPEVIAVFKSVQDQESGVVGAVQLQAAGEQQFPFLPVPPPGRAQLLRRALAPLSGSRQQRAAKTSADGVGAWVINGNASLFCYSAGVLVFDVKRVGIAKNVLIPGAEMQSRAQILILTSLVAA